MEDIPLESGYQSEEGVLLHGHLDIWIYEARCLPNMDVIAKQLHRCFAPCWDPFESIHREKEAAPAHRDRRDRRLKVTSDPYVTVLLAGATVARTRVIRNAEFPVWNQHFVVPVAHRVDFVKFTVKDNDFFGAETIGSVDIPASQVLSGEPIQGWFPVLDPSEKPPKRDSELMISLQYKPVELNPAYMHSIAGNPQKSGVEGTYFPLRKGGMVTLYQDAHVNDGDLCVPEIKLEHGKVFEHSKCWEDICHAILEAHHLVYIVGWSIYHEVRLVREPTKSLPEAGRLTLGELLKHKSQEGVRVCLLVWDDRTSHDKFLLKTGGIMQTHDEETRNFFKHSSVICMLSPRYPSSKLSLFKQMVVGTLFTHHQKCVLVDTQASHGNRKITAFIGGLDLCDGRYDTPRHRLFQDVDTVFHNDFHNPTFSAETKGPRQPWHDLHCKIEGPAAFDVLKNFEQRWREARKWGGFRIFFKGEPLFSDDVLLKIERISWILSPSPTVPVDHPSLWASQEDDPENWHVQVFRSVDSGSVQGFPKTVKAAENENLVCSKDLKIDRSIHTAYVTAIRSAKHFIYIENQYFIGSSYGWPSYRNPEADNLIPMELALKICSKIRAKERFAVYIVIPMWPEGVPTSSSVQEILFWQGQTIEMMYKIVARELKSQKMNQHPQEYLNFYCLGKREPEETSQPKNQDSETSAVILSRKNRRFMIYVHAKGMIVDDEYVIVGSANINQRSLDGSRDTEIAMGAYQPHHTWAVKNRHPHGQVYGYRMSLWAEHLGNVEGCFEEPHMLKCVERVNERAKENWLSFTAEAMIPTEGHLLRYPINVDADGNVNRRDQEQFPDVGGMVLGAETTLPDALTM